MSREVLRRDHFSPDTQEFVYLLYRHKVRYLIVGGEAVIYYGYARLTGDVDFFFDTSGDNPEKLFGALDEFWEGDIPEINSTDELLKDGLIIQFGRPPNRIDLINRISGVRFEEAWDSRHMVHMYRGEELIPIYLIGLENLIRNKESSGRPKDLADTVYLKGAFHAKK